MTKEEKVDEIVKKGNWGLTGQMTDFHGRVIDFYHKIEVINKAKREGAWHVKVDVEDAGLDPIVPWGIRESGFNKATIISFIHDYECRDTGAWLHIVYEDDRITIESSNIPYVTCYYDDREKAI